MRALVITASVSAIQGNGFDDAEVPDGLLMSRAAYRVLSL